MPPLDFDEDYDRWHDDGGPFTDEDYDDEPLHEREYEDDDTSGQDRDDYSDDQDRDNYTVDDGCYDENDY